MRTADRLTVRRMSCAIRHPDLLTCASLSAAAVHAQVTRLEIASREPFKGSQPAGEAGPYEIIRGKIHGEVDPARSAQHGSFRIWSSRRATRAAGSSTSQRLRSPSRWIPLVASGILVYQVVNRGNGDATASAEGHISLVSGWQGDVAPTASNQTIVVPIARNRDGSALTGPVIARFYNVAAGTNTVPIRLSSMGNAPPPYPPADLEQLTATLTMHASESSTGLKGGSAAGAAASVGLCGLPEHAVSRHAGSDPVCASRTASTRRSCTSWSTRQGIRSCWGSDWPQRATSCRSSAMPRQMPPARQTRSQAWFRMRLPSGTRSRAISSRRSFTSVSIRTSRSTSSGTACFRALPRGRRPSTFDSRCRAAPARCTSLAASRSSGGAVSGQGRAGDTPQAFSIGARPATPARRSSRHSERRSSGVSECRPD